MKTALVAEMISQGGRTGRVEGPDGILSIDLAMPTDENPGATTPEQLFAGAYAACFHSAILNAAEKAHLHIEGSTVIGRAQLLENDDGGYELAVELRAALPGVDEDDAQRLLRQAHNTCPYSKATRGNIDVKLTLD